MEKGTTFVGLDVQKEAVNVAMLLPGETRPVERQTGNDPAAVRCLVRELQRSAVGGGRGGPEPLPGPRGRPWRCRPGRHRPSQLLRRCGCTWNGGEKVRGQGQRLCLCSLRFERKEGHRVLEDHLLALDHRAALL